MSFEDKSIQCSDCGREFTHSVEDQEYYQSKGYTNEPRRCPDCRQSRKAERNGRSSNRSSNSGFGYSAKRQMYPAVCAQCGKETEIPFQPREDRPVYCSDCYRKIKPNR
ncbi:MAG: zinc-ribbon domain containing protein [Dehalococcoidales bacterium]|nr:zinc-ribbon domain containing protein [Dehalococcoidales bacterium]